MLDAFNRHGGFANLDDTETRLREILAASFDQVDLEVVGSVALFAAANSRSSPGSRDQTGLKASNG